MPNNYINNETELVGQNKKLAERIKKLEIENQMLNEKVEKYSELCNLLPETVFETDLMGNITYVNDKAYHMFGYNQDDFIGGLNCLQMLCPEERDKALNNMMRVFNGEPLYGIKYNALRKDGSRFVIAVYPTVVINNNKPVGMRGVIIELKEPMKANEPGMDYKHYLEARVKEQSTQLGLSVNQLEREVNEYIQTEEWFYRVFNHSPGLIVITTLDGRYIEVNQNFLRTTGYNREEVIGHTAADLNIYVQPEVRHTWLPSFLKHKKVENMKVRYRMKTGEERIGLSSAQLIDFKGENCLLAIVIDITEKEQMESDMARLERLNLIGQIAAGIGHEIRNPISSVRGFLQLVAEKDGCMEYQEFFNIMMDELDRANSIINEFLAMAKSKSTNKVQENINDIINSILPLIKADAIKYNHEIVVALEDVPDLLLDSKEIRQLIFNLVRNGLEAMSLGKKLTLGTSFDGKMVVLKVKDEGNGMDEKIISNIGSPFFTTKENGTGLGLAVCHSIAQRHNGKITFESGPLGTTFNVSLPC